MKHIGITATEDDHAAWSAAAKADGRSLSSWIGRRCNGQPTTAPGTERKPHEVTP